MPSNQDVSHSQVIVYTKPNCKCSAAALNVLRDEGVEPIIASLADHCDLSAAHGDVSPVVVIGGRVRFVGRVEPVLLRRLLAHG